MDLIFQYMTRFIDFLSFDTGLLAQPTMIARLSVQGALLFCSSFFSGSETALFSVSDVDLEQLRRKRHPRADLLHSLLSQPRRLIVSILCGNELINIAATANMTGILVILYGFERAGLVSILVMVPLLLLFGEITPKTIAVSYPVQVSTDIVCIPMNLWMRLITPLRWVVRLVADRVTTWIVGEARDPDHLLRMSEFRSLVAEIEEEGLLSATDRVLVYNLLDAGSTEIIHVMTPRTEVQFVSADSPLSLVAEELSEHKWLRLPVYEKTRDNVIGVVSLTPWKIAQPDLSGSLDDLIDPPYYAAPRQTLGQLLPVLKRRKDQTAIIVDEFGSAIGMVTLEDILEVVIGEVKLGYHYEKHPYRRKRTFEIVEDGVYLLDARLPISEVNDVIGLNLPAGDFRTVGGMLLARLRHVPKEGEYVVDAGYSFTVTEATEKSAVRVRAEPEA